MCVSLVFTVLYMNKYISSRKPLMSGRASEELYRDLGLFIATRDRRVSSSWTEIKACSHGVKSGTAGIRFM